jgi:glycosyltransferase involved in cell wall biosynthesis
MNLLTIAIPTYNRRILLENALNSLEKINFSDVEILISDNCSTDGTDLFIRSYMGRYPRIKYYRNSENIGPDKNFLNCLEKATGEFVLLLSDDDMVDSDTFENLYYYLKSIPETIGIVILNSRIIGDKKEKTYFKNSGYHTFCHEENHAFFNKIGIMLTFISTIVFKKKFFNMISDKKKFLKTNLVQTGIIFQIATLSGVGTAIFPDTVIVSTLNCSGSYNFYDVFISSWKKVLFSEENLSYIPKSKLQSIYSMTLKHYIFSWIILFKTEKQKFTFVGGFRWRHLRDIFAYIVTWTKIIPILIMPAFLVKTLYILFSKKKSK